MKVVLQRVTAAAVTVDGVVVGRIGRGYLLLVGLAVGDDETTVRRLAADVAKARLMPDTELCLLMGDDIDIDVDPHEHWDAKEDALAVILLKGLRRMKN